jgi:hypothetical protein
MPQAQVEELVLRGKVMLAEIILILVAVLAAAVLAVLVQIHLL